ncbi:MAG TPA: NlpC/P60 family N-terminal domain-containing protein [Smithellaceae bacterium]|nr:NlpC/P60 family N-terminal domain-containing protein [Smithellaceae bacterium]HRV44763.1 NlpC/P60 family N-terminal domain-containing protein [Smithellaceae bacterium]
MNRLYGLAIIFFFILSGCVSAPDTVRDVRELRQDHAFYLTDRADPLPAALQARMDGDYNTIYFSVWHQSRPFHAWEERVRHDFKRYALRPGYGENKKPHPSSWLKKMQQNADLEGYPNALTRGITIRNTNLRELPTNSPHFTSANGDSSAWPFDNLQRSSVPTGTPVFIAHVSADKAWALVETSFTYGWMPVEDFARVNEDFIKTWESGRYAVILRDATSVLDQNGRFLVKASVGHLFPFTAIKDGKVQLCVAMADQNRRAVIRQGFVPAEAAAAKPLRFTPANAARVANELIGEPYGWGGLYGNRDCSAMTRDFFTVFGIWLPRHSEDQVKEAGAYIDLRGLSPEEKERIIMEKGVPYLSLLWRKGHVMLYIGAPQGRALIFHNIWGIRTKDLQGREGRKIIGQAVITGLTPGRELSDMDTAAGSLLDNIAAMNILSADVREAPAP